MGTPYTNSTPYITIPTTSSIYLGIQNTYEKSPFITAASLIDSTVKYSPTAWTDPDSNRTKSFYVGGGGQVGTSAVYHMKYQQGLPFSTLFNLTSGISTCTPSFPFTTSIVGGADGFNMADIEGIGSRGRLITRGRSTWAALGTYVNGTTSSWYTNILYSLDGQNWIPSLTGYGMDGYDIRYFRGDDIFIATGCPNGRILGTHIPTYFYSSDAVTWSSSYLTSTMITGGTGLSSIFYAVTYTSTLANPFYFAIGYFASNVSLTPDRQASTITSGWVTSSIWDPTSWRQRTMPVSFSTVVTGNILNKWNLEWLGRSWVITNCNSRSVYTFDSGFNTLTLTNPIGGFSYGVVVSDDYSQFMSYNVSGASLYTITNGLPGSGTFITNSGVTPSISVAFWDVTRFSFLTGTTLYTVAGTTATSRGTISGLGTSNLYLTAASWNLQYGLAIADAPSTVTGYWQFSTPMLQIPTTDGWSTLQVSKTNALLIPNTPSVKFRYVVGRPSTTIQTLTAYPWDTTQFTPFTTINPTLINAVTNVSSAISTTPVYFTLSTFFFPFTPFLSSSTGQHASTFSLSSIYGTGFNTITNTTSLVGNSMDEVYSLYSPYYTDINSNVYTNGPLISSFVLTDLPTIPAASWYITSSLSGPSWSLLQTPITPSTSLTLTIHPSTRIALYTTSNIASTYTLKLRMANNSEGAPFFSTVDTSYLNDPAFSYLYLSSPYTLSTVNLQIQVLYANIPPYFPTSGLSSFLSTTSFTASTITYTTSSLVNTIQSLTSWNDGDSTAYTPSTGLVITQASSTIVGCWQYSTPSQAITGAWSTLIVSPTAAFTIPTSSMVSLRFLQRVNSTSVQSLTVIPWDQTGYTPFQVINTTLQNFSSAISSTPFTFTMSTLFFPYQPYLSSAGQHASTTNVLSIYPNGIHPITNAPGIYGVTTSTIFGQFRNYFYDVTSRVYTKDVYTSTLVLTDLPSVENATWYITSSIAGPSWSVLPTITPSTSLLLPINVSTQIALYTTNNLPSTYTFTMRAGNRTDLAPYFSIVDTSYLNDPAFSYLYLSSPYTTSSLNLRVTALSVNNPPFFSTVGLSAFLSTTTYTASTIAYTTQTLVSTIQTLTPWIDIDTSIYTPSTALVITQASSTIVGSWQYSTASQSITGAWSTLIVSPTAAFTLPTSSIVSLRFVQRVNSTSVQSLTVIPWDQTKYTSYQTINTTLQNFSSAISTTPITFTMSTLFFPYQPYLSSSGKHASTTNVLSVYANGYNPNTNLPGINGVTTSSIFGLYRTYFYDITSRVYTKDIYTSTLVLTDLPSVENATWYITSSITGPSWSVLPIITPSTSLLLPINTSTQVALFTSTNIQTSTYTLTMRAGNRTDLAPYFSIVDTSYLNDPAFSYLYLSSPYTRSTINLQVTALHVNTPPYITIPTTSSFFFGSTVYGKQTQGYSIPFTTSTLVGLIQSYSPGNTTWIDTNSIYTPSTGFAVLSAESTATGSWQYSTPSQSIPGGWSTLIVSPTSALLFPNLSTCYLRYAQATNSTSIQTLGVIPWNQSSGTPFSLINSLTSNYSTSISSTPFTFTLSTFSYKSPPYLSSANGQHFSTCFMSSIYQIPSTLTGTSMLDFYNVFKPYFFDVKEPSDTTIYGSTMVITSLPTVSQGGWYITSSLTTRSWSLLPPITPSTAFTVSIASTTRIALYTNYNATPSYTFQMRMGNGADSVPVFSTIDLSFLEPSGVSDPRIGTSAYTFSTLNIGINVLYINTPPFFSTTSTLYGGTMYYGNDDVNYGILTGASIVDTILKSSPNSWIDYDSSQKKKIYYAGGIVSGTSFNLAYQPTLPISSLYSFANTVNSYATVQTFSGTPISGIAGFNYSEDYGRNAWGNLLVRGRATTVIVSKVVDNIDWATSHAYSIDGSNWTVSLVKTGLAGYEARYFPDDDIFITTGFPVIVPSPTLYSSSLSYLYSRDGISWTPAIVTGNNGTQTISTVFYSVTYTSSATYKATGKTPFYFALGIPLTTIAVSPNATTSIGPVAGWVTSSIWDPSSWRYQTLPTALSNETTKFSKWTVSWLGNSFLVTTPYALANPSYAYFDTSFQSITNKFSVSNSYEPVVNDSFTHAFTYNVSSSYIHRIVDGQITTNYQIPNQAGFPPTPGQVLWDDSKFLTLNLTNLYSIDPVTTYTTQLSDSIPTGGNGTAWPYFYMTSWYVQRGIAIISATSTNVGSWYYSTSINSTSWTNISSVSMYNALLIPESHNITFQFRTNRPYKSTESLTVVPWDMTQYSAFQYINLNLTSKYIGATVTGKSLYSYDGVSWNIVNPPIASGINTIVWDGSNQSIYLNSVLPPSTRNRSTIAYSYNGRSVNYITGSGFYYGGLAAAWNGSMWVAVGSNDATSGSILYSYNGITWSIASGGFPRSTGRTILWNGSMWIAGGDSAATPVSSGTLLYSYNGTTWNTSSIRGGFKTRTEVVVWNGSNQHLAMGYNGAGVTSGTIQYSSDGIQWTNTNAILNSASNAVWNGSNLWVVVGNTYSTGNTSNILYSSDGISWLTANGGFTGYGVDVAYNGSNMWVAVGSDASPLGTIKYSSDGSNWSNITGTGFSLTGKTITWNGSNMWIAGGSYGVLYSYNGSNWFTTNITTDHVNKLLATPTTFVENISSSVSYTPTSIQVNVLEIPYQPYLSSGYTSSITLSSIYTSGFDAITQTRQIRGISMANLYSIYSPYFKNVSLPYASTFVLTDVPNIPNHTWFITSSITGPSWSPLQTPITPSTSFILNTHPSTQLALYTSSGIVSTYSLTMRMGNLLDGLSFFSTVDTSYLLNPANLPYISSPCTQSTITLRVSVLFVNNPSYLSTSGVSTTLGITDRVNIGYIVDTSTLVGSIVSTTKWVDGTSYADKSMYYAMGGSVFSLQLGLPFSNSLTSFATNLSFGNATYGDLPGTYGRLFARGRTTTVMFPTIATTSGIGVFNAYSFNGTNWFTNTTYPPSVIVPSYSYVQQNMFEVRYFSANDIFIACAYNRADPSWATAHPMFSPTYYYSQSGILWKPGFLTSTLGTTSLSSIFCSVTLGSNASYANGNPFYLALGVLVRYINSNSYSITNVSTGIMAWRTSSIFDPSSWQQINLPSNFITDAGNPGTLYTRPSTLVGNSVAPKWNLSWLGNSWLLTHFLYPGALYLHSTLTTGQVLYTTPSFNPAPSGSNGFYEPVLNSTGTYALLPGNKNPLYGFNISSGILTDTTANVFSTVGGALSSVVRDWKGGIALDRSNFIVFSSVTQFIGTTNVFSTSIATIPTGTDGSTWLSLHSFPYNTQRGLAITNADATTMGSWQISTHRFAWSTIRPTPTNAILLPESADILFRFNLSTTSTSVQNFTVVPWDLTQYTPFQGVNITTLNYSTSISTTPYVFSISTLTLFSSPVISSGALATFSTQRGDNGSPSIVSISSFISFLSTSQLYRDGTAGDPRGLFLTSTTGPNIGVWQYKTSTLSTWTTITNISETRSFALSDSPETLLNFSTLLNVNSTVSLFFKAWNRLDRTPVLEGSYLDTSLRDGGSISYSASTVRVYISTIRVNAAPIVRPLQTIQLTNTSADSTNMLYYTTQQLSTLLSTSWYDPDATRGYLKSTAGIAITYAPYGTTGYWQISTPSFTTSAGGWSTLNSITPENAYILPFSSIYALRFVPASNYLSTYSLDFRAWTSHAFGALSTVNLTDPTTYGASTPFSFYTNRIAINATRPNFRPYLQNTVSIEGSTLYADNSQPSALSISSLITALGTNYQDPDLDDPQLNNSKGLALIYAANTGAAGYYQVSTVSMDWSTLTTPISTNTALLLGSTSFLKFVPTYNTTSSYTLKFRLWDGTDGNPEGLARVNTQSADLPTLSLSSVYSYSTFSLAFSTVFINHAPTLPSSLSYTLSSVMGANVFTNIVTTAYISSVIGQSYSDSDLVTGQKQGLALVYTNSTSVSYWQLSTPINEWSTLGGISTNTSLMLDISYSTLLRWVLNDETNTTSTQLKFLLWDQSQYGLLSTVELLDDRQTAFSTPFSYMASTVTLFQNSLPFNKSPYITTNTNAVTVYLSSIYGAGLNLDMTTPNSPAPTTLFSTLISTQYGENTASNARGFALIYASQQTTGRWLFSNVSMTSFSTVPSYVSTNAAITTDISPTTSFVFSTSVNGNTGNTSAFLRFRLWNQRDLISTGTLVDTSYLDAPPANFIYSTPYSQSSFTVAINLLKINYAPVLSSGTTLSLSNVSGSDTNPPSLSISTLLTSFQPYYTDRNTTDRRGIAITYAPSTSMGYWQISTHQIAAFSTLHLTSDAEPSLFLTSTASLRFVPSLNVTSTVSLLFRAWDQTSYDSLSTATTAFASPPTQFLSTSYSYSTATLQFAVKTVNIPPILLSTSMFALSTQYAFYSSEYSDSYNPIYGTSVTSLFTLMDSNYFDVDPDSAKGVALIGLSTTTGTGTWWIASTLQGNGQPFLQTMPPISIQSALLLDATDSNRLIFLPAINSTSQTSLTFRIWDQSDILPSFTSNYNLSFMEAPTSLSTAYSYSTVTFTLVNTPYNFAPALSTSIVLPLPPVDGTNTNPSATPLTSVLSLLQPYWTNSNATDRRGIAITYAPSTVIGYWQVSTPQIAAFSTLHLTSDAEPSLFLTSTASFRFVPTMNMTSTLSLGFRAWNQTSYGSLSTATTAFASIPNRFLSTSYSYSTARLQLTVRGINNSPILLSTVKFALSSQYSFYDSNYMGDLGNTYGTSIADCFTLLGSNYYDIDITDSKGLAILGFSTLQGTGTWYYTSTSQGVLQQTPLTQIQRALLLSDANIRFIPSINSTFTASFTARIWDQTDRLLNNTSNYDMRFMEAPTNFSTAYSFSTVTFTVQNIRYNFAPAISTTTQVSLSNLEAIAPNPPALSVSSLLTAIQGQVSDPNTDDRRGIAITYAPSTAMGFWQISTPQIAAFSTLHLTSEADPSLFLTSSATFRFLPKLNVTSTVSLLFRVWDQTTYGPLSTAITSFAFPPDRFLSTSYSFSTAAVSFNLFHVNNAPTLTSTLSYALSTQYSINPSPLDPNYGTSVTDLFNLIGSDYSDIDPLDGKGVALIGVSTLQGTGTWYVASTLQGNGQPFLQSMPGISIQSSFLLNASATNRLVFLPTNNSTFQTSLTFRVWDQTDALPSFTSNYDLRFMESPTNVSTAYSFSTVTFTLQSARYNFAPAISTTTAVTLSNVLGDDTNPPALSFQTLLASIQSQIYERNIDDRLGVAITRAPSTSIGYWQISTPQIASFSTLHLTSDAQPSLFLTSTASLRFVPGMNSNSTVSLAFRLWDRTAYDSLSTATTAFASPPSPITFLSTSYSYSTALLYFSVSHVNHAPWITTSSIQTRIGLTSSIFQDTVYKGDSVYALLSALSTNYNERDENDRTGLAIVGTTQTETQGQWQLSSLTQGWTALPSPISESSALLLSSLTTTFLRFSTGINLNGSATFTFRLWDGYDGFPDATYPYAITGTGGNTSYSSNTVIGTTNFYSVNRAPVLDPSTIVMGSTVYGDTNPVYTYNRFQFTRLTSLFTALDANNWYTDVDVSPQRGIGIIYAPSTSAGAWQISQDITQQTPTWSNLHILSTNSTFLMARATTNAIRFLPGLNVTSTYTMKFVAWDQTGPETNLTFTTITETGGKTPFSLSSGSFYVSTLYVNAAPVLQTNTSFFSDPVIPCLDTSYANIGVTVSSILSSISSAFSDPNPSSLRGIALTLNTVPESIGALQLSYTDRANPSFLNSFANIPSIPDATMSFTLPFEGPGNPSPSSLSLRFVPAPTFNTTSTFVFPFRAWDQTDGYGFTTLDTSKNGLSTSVSVKEGYLLFSTVHINQPPILTEGTTTSLPLLEGFLAPSQSITTSDFLTSIASSTSFPNTIDQPGLALFNAGQGSWQVYTPTFPSDGWSTINIGYATSNISYYLLPSSTTTKLRFIAPTNTTTVYSVKYALWNQTAFTPFTQTTIPTNVSTSISPTSGTLQIQTSRINYPPVISTGTYQGGIFNGDNVGNTGIGINTLIDSLFNYTDINTDDEKGIAIRGYTASYLPNRGYTADGVLQYKRYSDDSWTNIYLGQGFVDRRNAFVLPYDAVNPYSVRVSTFSNTYADYRLETYGWDKTQGTPLTFNSMTTLQTVSPEKGSLSYDQTKQVLQSSFIQFSNSYVFHSPILLNDVIIPSYPSIPRENEGYSISSIIGYLGNQYIDPNLGQYGTGRGIALISLSPNDATGVWEYSLNAGSNWSLIQSTTTNLQTASLLLKGSGSTGVNNKIRFKPAKNESYTNVHFSFIAWDERYFSNGSIHFITVSEQGGTNTFSSENATCYFNINQIYYAPSTIAYTANVGSMYSDNTSNTTSYDPDIGLSVRNILYTPSFGYADPNIGMNTQRGMAITSGSITQGRWQYRQGNSQQWVTINAYVNETTSTLLLPEDSYLRFNNVTVGSSVANLTWLAWSPFQETAYNYVSSATTRGPNGPFSEKSLSQPYTPTLTMNIVLAPSPPSVGPWPYMIPYPLNVSYDPSKNTPVPLTSLLSLTGVNYTDTYTPNIRGFIITPIPVDGVSTTIKGVFTNSLNSAFSCSPPASMLLYTRTGVNPTISFTADQSDLLMNVDGVVSFQARAWNGGALSIGSSVPANGAIIDSELPPFTIHGSFSERVLTFNITCKRAGTAPAFDVPEPYVPPPIVDGSAAVTTSFIDINTIYNSMNVI